MVDMGVGRNVEVDPPTERDVLTLEAQINGGDKQIKDGAGERPESEVPVRMRMQPSPAPFSRYQTSGEHEEHEGRSRLPAGLTTADVKTPGHGRIVHGEDEPSSGCCKCVIM
jgi:hypothetical protein